MSVARQYNTPGGPVATTRSARRLAPAEAAAVAPAFPFSVFILGIVAVVVAAWGAAAPYAAPNFGYYANTTSAWTWTETAALLALAPGALAVLAGLSVIFASPLRRWGRRPDLWILGLLIAASGAWFVVGQFVYPVINGAAFIMPASASTFMYKELAFAVGPGVILVYCGAMFMGWATRRHVAVVAEPYPRVVPPAAAPAAAGPMAPPMAAGPMAAGPRGLHERPVTSVPQAGAPTETMAPPPPVAGPGPEPAAGARPVEPGEETIVRRNDVPPAPPV